MSNDKPKILVVDDEADVAIYLKTVLEASGYRVETADTVDAGLELVDSYRPDLLCLDIMMPKKTGITMYVDLKNRDEWRDLPVAIVSGVGQNNQFDFRSYVPDESVPPPEVFVEKPIVVESFLKTISKLLDRRYGKKAN